MEVDASGWSGDGDFTQRLIDAIREVPAVSFLKVEDAPASRGDGAFSFISNELFVVFATSRRVTRTRRLGFLPGSTSFRPTQFGPFSQVGVSFRQWSVHVRRGRW